MTDLTPYIETKQAEVATIIDSISKIVIADDDGCRELIDTRVMLADTMAQIDAKILLHNQPLQAQIDGANKQGNDLKLSLQGCAEGAKAEIYRYMDDTRAQRIKSGAETAYFRENKDKLTLDIDESKLTDKFFKRTPDQTKIKKHFLETGKAPKGVTVTIEEQDSTLIFKAVK